MPFTVTQASSVMMSSPSPTNGAQDLHAQALVLTAAKKKKKSIPLLPYFLFSYLLL